MICVYCVICALTMLSGCAWWDNAKKEVAEEQCMSSEIVDSMEMVSVCGDDSCVHQTMVSTDAQPIPVIIDTNQTGQKASITRREFRKRRSRKKIIQNDHRATSIVEENFPRTITIHNAIDAQMLTVRHWTGVYTPNILTIRINDETIPVITMGVFSADLCHTVSVCGETFTVEYYYEFMNGLRREKNCFRYTVAKNVTKLAMSFSWDTPWHVAFDQATPITV
jgi:hypothetical protein